MKIESCYDVVEFKIRKCYELWEDKDFDGFYTEYMKLKGFVECMEVIGESGVRWFRDYKGLEDLYKKLDYIEIH